MRGLDEESSNLIEHSDSTLENSTLVNLLQLKKAFLPIKLTVLGILIYHRPPQLEKAHEQMVSTDSGIITDVREQSSKDAYPIDLTEFGIVIDVIERQPENALGPNFGV